MAHKTKRMVHHIPITKARQTLGQVVRRVSLNKEYVVLEKGGVPVAGIVDIDELEDLLEMQDPELQQQIEESYKAYQRGEARDIDELLAELRTPKPGKRSTNKKA